MLGHRRVLLACIALFAAASILCGLTPTTASPEAVATGMRTAFAVAAALIVAALRSPSPAALDSASLSTKEVRPINVVTGQGRRVVTAWLTVPMWAGRLRICDPPGWR